MERIDAFEKMLRDLLQQSEDEKALMDKLKAEGKEKSATYRQLMGNRLVYSRLLSLYREYGLLD